MEDPFPSLEEKDLPSVFPIKKVENLSYQPEEPIIYEQLINNEEVLEMTDPIPEPYESENDQDGPHLLMHHSGAGP